MPDAFTELAPLYGVSTGETAVLLDGPACGHRVEIPQLLPRLIIDGTPLPAVGDRFNPNGPLMFVRYMYELLVDSNGLPSRADDGALRYHFVLG